MSQHYVPKSYPSCFRAGMPTLLYAWKKQVGEDFSPPRIMHSHSDCIELMLVVHGSASYTVGERRYTTKEGDLVVLNAGVLHDEDARLAASTTVFGIALRNVFLTGMPDNALLPDGACPVVPLGDFFTTVREVFSTIHTLLSGDNMQHAEACQLLACGLTSMLAGYIRQTDTLSAPNSKDQYLTSRIRAYIDEHYSEDITLQSIGDALHVNRYYLAHVFKETTGYSPMQYVTRLRIGNAQALLSETNYPITQISGMVGYDNPSHFNAMFTKYIGISPGKYRKTFLPPKTPKSGK